MTDATIEVLEKVAAERSNQDAKWGEQNHDPGKWLAILTEEVGELAKEMLEYDADPVETVSMRREAIQVAAVAVAFIEYLDRRVAKGGR